eukprot:11986315-Alexandrium_andersonii.AAC.1
MRCVLPFDEWPWALGKIANAEASSADELYVYRSLANVNSCCTWLSDGFTEPFKRTARLAEATFATADRQYIRDVFSMALNSNIAVEDRFARARRHLMPSQGNDPHASTMASNHALAEWRAMHEACKRKLAPQVSLAVGYR